MDLSSLLGVMGAVALLSFGIISGEIGGVFLNFHGLLVVVGGTTVAMLINTPMRYLRDTVKDVLKLLRRHPFEDPEGMIPELIRLAEQVQRNGMTALRDIPDRLAGGFLAAAATTALEYNNPEFVRKVLEDEVNNEVDRANEVINVIRTAGVLSPMFGLIGTLIGIVQVLQQIADPEKVGPAMAIAITSAFYGIVLANIVFVPIAGKMRVRLWEQVKVKAMVIEGISGIMKGTVPLVLERRLQSLK